MYIRPLLSTIYTLKSGFYTTLALAAGLLRDAELSLSSLQTEHESAL